MTLARVNAAAVVGLDGQMVEVQVDIAAGLKIDCAEWPAGYVLGNSRWRFLAYTHRRTNMGHIISVEHMTII